MNSSGHCIARYRPVKKAAIQVLLRCLFILMAAAALVAALVACSGEPSTDQPEVNLASLSMSADTTGKDVLDRVSEAEGECFSTAVGEDAYEAFLGGGVHLE